LRAPRAAFFQGDKAAVDQYGVIAAADAQRGKHVIAGPVLVDLIAQHHLIGRVIDAARGYLAVFHIVQFVHRELLIKVERRRFDLREQAGIESRSFFAPIYLPETQTNHSNHCRHHQQGSYDPTRGKKAAQHSSFHFLQNHFLQTISK
jgi:hypothetical protein